MKKDIIWSNEHDYLTNTYAYITENEHFDTEEDKWDYIEELNDMYIKEERLNLDIDLPEEIVVIADVVTWGGPLKGYKFMGTNIANCLYDKCDYVEWYCDRYNFKGNATHHDGTNHYLYRMWREGITDRQKRNFLSALTHGVLTDNMITRYTKSLRPYIAKVYGW